MHNAAYIHPSHDSILELRRTFPNGLLKAQQIELTRHQTPTHWPINVYASVELSTRFIYVQLFQKLVR